MVGRHIPRTGRILAATVAAFAVSVCSATAASAATVFSNLPSTLPGNLPSEAFQATQSSEFGGQIVLAPVSRTNPVVTATMSSWGCQTGGGVTCLGNIHLRESPKRLKKNRRARAVLSLDCVIQPRAIRVPFLCVAHGVQWALPLWSLRRMGGGSQNIASHYRTTEFSRRFGDAADAYRRSGPFSN